MRASLLAVNWVVGWLAVTCGSSSLHAQRLQTAPDAGQVTTSTLSTEDTDAERLILTLMRDQSVAMRPQQNSQRQYWVLSPTGRNTFRIQLFDAGRLWSLSANGPASTVSLNPSAQSAEQLWRVIPSLAVADAVRFESIAFPGRYLAGARDSVVGLERASGSPTQNWFLDATPPPPQIVVPAVEMVQHTIRPEPILSKAKTTLFNSHNNELWVVVADLRGGPAQHLKIPARGSIDIELDRDPGATIVESYQVTNNFGEVYSEQFTTAVPPATLYDITVYERFLQSIAIDRTGKSPNKIEDVNYQPKSVGLFVIPPGNQFRGGEVDVFQTAKRQNNAGGVRPIRLEDWEIKETKEDPVERTLREALGR